MKLLLTPLEGSLAFSERSLEVDPRSGCLTVSRASAQLKAATNNAVFDCKVLSRSHAEILGSRGKIFLKDNGSRNGSFINNHRLGTTFQESESTVLYSDDIIRFGAQARDDVTVVEKCIIARVKILDDQGKTVGIRPAHDKLNNTAKINDNLSKQLSNLQESLKREQDATKTLRDSLDISKRNEIHLQQEVKTLNLQADKEKSDLSNSFNSTIEEKEALLDKQITLLKTATEDLAKAKGALVTSNGFLRIKEDKLVKLEKSYEELNSHNTVNLEKLKILEEDNSRLKAEHSSMSEEKKNLAKEVNLKTTLMKEKDEEITNLKTLVEADESELKETTGAYNELESLMTEEDATLLEAEEEIKKLLEIIAENQDTILKKDKNIIMLQNIIKEKEEYVKNELGGITKAEMEKQCNEAIINKDLEIETMKNQMKVALEDLDSKTHKIEKEIDRNREAILLKDAEIDDLNAKLNEQTKHVATHDALKVKCEELMKIIMKLNADMEKLKNDVAIQDAILARNETLQKEILISKVSTQQKETDLQNYKELLAAKEKTIASIKKLHIDSDKEHGQFREKVATVVEEYEEEMSNLMQKIVKEQEINEQSENEIIQLRIELDNVRKETGYYGDMSKDEHIELLQIKDQELDGMKNEILKEQQVNGHVHMVQEKELIDKDRAITFLNKQLGIKQKEIDCLRKLNKKGNSRERSVTLSPNGEDETIEQNLESEVEDDFIFVEDLKNDEENGVRDNIPLG